MTQDADSADAAEVPVVESGEAIARLELDNVVPIELRARRRDGGFDDLEPPDPDLTDDQIADSRQIPQMQIFQQELEDVVLVRVRAEGTTDKSEYVADIAVVYKKSEPFRMTEQATSDVIDLLAMPNLYPYLRQHIFDITSRIGDPLTFGLARFGRGSVQRIVDEDGTSDEEQQL